MNAPSEDTSLTTLQAEVSTLRDHLAEVNRLMSLNVAEVERLQGALHIAYEALKNAYCHTKSTSMANDYLERALNALYKMGFK